MTRSAAAVRSHSIVEAQVLPLIVKFGLAGRSVAVFTEALGAQRHHGHVAMLVNEHSASAAEMVAAFASDISWRRSLERQPLAGWWRRAPSRWGLAIAS